MNENIIMPYFALPLDSIEITEDLSQCQKGQLFDLIVNYGNGNEIDKNDYEALVWIAFKHIKIYADKKSNEYVRKVTSSRANGKKGGRPKKTADKEPNETQESENNPEVNSETQKTQCFFSEPKKANKTKVNKTKGMLFPKGNNNSFTSTDAPATDTPLGGGQSGSVRKRPETDMKKIIKLYYGKENEELYNEFVLEYERNGNDWSDSGKYIEELKDLCTKRREAEHLGK